MDFPGVQTTAGHAYWVSGLTLRSSSGTAPLGTIDVRSRGFGLGDPTPSATTTGGGALTGGASPAIPYTSRTKTWGQRPEHARRGSARHKRDQHLGRDDRRYASEGELQRAAEHHERRAAEREHGELPVIRATEGRDAPVCVARARVRAVHQPEPRAWTATGIWLVQPAAAGFRPAHGRDVRRQRQAANSVGSVRYGVVTGGDVNVTVSVTDVRKQSDLSDYTGELQVNPSVRITDRNNGPSGRRSGDRPGHHLPDDGVLRRHLEHLDRRDLRPDLELQRGRSRRRGAGQARDLAARGGRGLRRRQ